MNIAAKPAATAQVVSFAQATSFRDIPEDVVALGKKSILDGLGLALSGSVAKSRRASSAAISTIWTCMPAQPR